MRRKTSELPASGRLMILTTLAGILAGLGAWAIGEATRNAFRPPMQRSEMMGQVIMKAEFVDQVSADYKNAIIAFAVLGGVMGLTFGMAGGMARGATGAGVRAGAIGLGSGILLGAGASAAILPAYFHALDVAPEALSRDLTLPLLVHGGIWAICGMVGGLALGLGLGTGKASMLRSALGGMIGAAIGAGLYEMIGAMAFPEGGTTQPIAYAWQMRLLARLLAAGLAGVFAAALIQAQARRGLASRPVVGAD